MISSTSSFRKGASLLSCFEFLTVFALALQACGGSSSGGTYLAVVDENGTDETVLFAVVNGTYSNFTIANRIY